MPKEEQRIIIMLARKSSHVGNMFETQFTYSWDSTSFMMYFGDREHALYPTQQHQVEAMKGPKPWTDVWWFHLFVCLALGDDLNRHSYVLNVLKKLTASRYCIVGPCPRRGLLPYFSTCCGLPGRGPPRLNRAWLPSDCRMAHATWIAVGGRCMAGGEITSEACAPLEVW